VDPPILDERRLNRALLARQLLLDRARMPVPKALERIGALQTQYAPAGYIGLRSRLDGFERDDLTRLLERKRVVQAWMMRSTIHMASPGDFRRFCAGVREARRRTWLKGFRRSAAEGRRAAERVERLLADGPLRRAEIVDALGLDSALWYGAGLWVDLVRVPPSGTWERPRADLYWLADRWLGAAPELTEDEAIAHLVRRYLAAYGPASRADVASWSGVAPQRLAAVLEGLRLRRFRDADGGELLDVPGAPVPDADAPAPVRLLGSWDAMLLAHARRTGVLPERHRERVFSTKAPQSFHTFLVDGRVAGTWRVDGDRFAVDAFERLSKATRAQLTDEGDRMLALWR
jgi:Winged helix DNA-binding domain